MIVVTDGGGGGCDSSNQTGTPQKIAWKPVTRWLRISSIQYGRLRTTENLKDQPHLPHLSQISFLVDYQTGSLGMTFLVNVSQKT